MSIRSRQCDTGRGLAFGDQNKIRSEIRPNIIMGFVSRPTFVLVQHGTCSRSAPELVLFYAFRATGPSRHRPYSITLSAYQIQSFHLNQISGRTVVKAIKNKAKG
jgi:hypothetical protein